MSKDKCLLLETLYSFSFTIEWVNPLNAIPQNSLSVLRHVGVHYPSTAG